MFQPKSNFSNQFIDLCSVYIMRVLSNKLQYNLQITSLLGGSVLIAYIIIISRFQKFFVFLFIQSYFPWGQLYVIIGYGNTDLYKYCEQILEIIRYESMISIPQCIHLFETQFKVLV